jgi:hypothetical protein
MEMFNRAPRERFLNDSSLMEYRVANILKGTSFNLLASLGIWHVEADRLVLAACVPESEK